MNFCWKDGVTEWRLCEDGEEYERHEKGPATYGPARPATEAPFFIVVGKGGSDTDDIHMELALYLANLHYTAYSTFAPIVLDIQLTEGMMAEGGYRNLILIGNAHQNAWTKKVMTEDAKSRERWISLSLRNTIGRAMLGSG